MAGNGSKRGSGNRGTGPHYQLQPSAAFAKSNMTTLVMLMISLFACFYTAGRLWEDAEMRSYFTRISEKRESQDKGLFQLSVEEQLKVLDCKDQQKKLAALEMEVTAAKSQGFGLKSMASGNGLTASRRLHAVVGVMTTFGTRTRRDAIRNSWMPKGEELKKLEQDQGIIIQFVIGRSANRGDMSDRRLDMESAESNDFLILNNHVESEDSLPLKTKLYFSTAVEKWDSDFYVKVDDDIFVNIEKLGSTLASHWDKPRVYLGCMKSGEVVSDATAQWYEPEWWKFGEDKSQYYQHAAAPLYALSKSLAQYVNINSASLHAYKNEDISVGSWMLGLDAEYVDDRHFCCVAPLAGSVCATRS